MIMKDPHWPDWTTRIIIDEDREGVTVVLVDLSCDSDSRAMNYRFRAAVEGLGWSESVVRVHVVMSAHGGRIGICYGDRGKILRAIQVFIKELTD
jgi:hypothetical protein